MVLSTDYAVYIVLRCRYRYYLKREEAHSDVVKI